MYYIWNIPTSTYINLGLHGFYIDYKPLRIRGQWDDHALGPPSRCSRRFCARKPLAAGKLALENSCLRARLQG